MPIVVVAHIMLLPNWSELLVIAHGCLKYIFPKKSSAETAVSYKPAKQRVAHVVKNNTPTGSLPRPRIPVEYGAKVPQSQRQRYLDRIVDEYLRLCSTEKEAFEKVILLRTDGNKTAIKIQN